MDKIVKAVVAAVVLLLAGCSTTKTTNKTTYKAVSWQKTQQKVIARYKPKAEPELASYFAKAKISYPPKQITLIALKKERKVELWAKQQGWHKIHDYPFTTFSGHLGPKLKENDRQIPEGIYKITSLNPFSSFHLSMMINYPNAYDKWHGLKDKRRHLGDNIFIHGKSASVGCIAIGDTAIEQLFVLVDEIGAANTKVIIAPNDLRKAKAKTPKRYQKPWINDLYAKIKDELRPYPV